MCHSSRSRSAFVLWQKIFRKSTQIWKMKGICRCALWYSAFRVKTAELNQRSERYILKDNYEHRKTNFWCAPGGWSRGSADGAAKEMWDRIKRGWVTGEGGGGVRQGDVLQRSNLLVKCCRSMRWTHFPAFSAGKLRRSVTQLKHKSTLRKREKPWNPISIILFAARQTTHFLNKISARG